MKAFQAKKKKLRAGIIPAFSFFESISYLQGNFKVMNSPLILPELLKYIFL